MSVADDNVQYVCSKVYCSLSCTHLYEKLGVGLDRWEVGSWWQHRLLVGSPSFWARTVALVMHDQQVMSCIHTLCVLLD